MAEKPGLGQVLERHPFFADMPPEVRAVLAGCASLVRVRAGEAIYREGEPADEFYLVREGRIGVEVHVPGRDPLVVETLLPGDILGWASLLPPYRWLFDARAIDDARLIRLDATCLRSKSEAEPAIGYALYRRFLPAVSRQLRSARVRLADLYGRPVPRQAP